MNPEPLWCEDFRKTVQHWLDGEQLTMSTRRGVREHREACPPCCDFYDNLVQLNALSENLLTPSEYDHPDDQELFDRIVEDVTKI